MLSDTRFIAAADVTLIAWREIGTGRPLLLVHGYFAGAHAHWIRPGHAAVLARAGARVIMPDLRGHGESGKPHDPRAYPSDVLAQDMQALVAALALRDYDIVGYSLGDRVVVRMLAHGTSPRRVILGGTGLEGIVAAESRADYFRTVLDHLGRHPPGSKAWLAEGFLRANKGDPATMRLVVDTIVSTPLDILVTFPCPILVVCGEDDQENGSALALADGHHRMIPGDHLGAATRPELAVTIAAFLGE